MMMLRINNRKESKLICKRSIRMEILGLILLLKLVIQEPIIFPEHSFSISGVNPDSVTG